MVEKFLRHGWKTGLSNCQTVPGDDNEVLPARVVLVKFPPSCQLAEFFSDMQKRPVFYHYATHVTDYVIDPTP